MFLTQRLSHKFVALFIQCNGIPKIVTETCTIVVRTLETLSAYCHVLQYPLSLLTYKVEADSSTVHKLVL